VICFSLSVLTLIITAFITKKYWNYYVKPLSDRHKYSFQDMVLIAVLVIDFLQLIAIGPKYEGMIPVIYDAGKMVSVDLSDVVEMKGGLFWIMLDVVYATCLLWFVCCLLVLKNFDLRFNWYLCKEFGYYAENILPFLSNACFIPIISILTDVFLCTESIGDDYTDSFLDRDCEQFCWTDDHIYYAVFAFVAFALYVPLAILTRPLWQFYIHDLHVYTLPRYFMVKSVLQTFLISIDKTVGRQ
jgi:hypothetical protein